MACWIAAIVERYWWSVNRLQLVMRKTRKNGVNKSESFISFRQWVNALLGRQTQNLEGKRPQPVGPLPCNGNHISYRPSIKWNQNKQILRYKSIDITYKWTHTESAEPGVPGFQ